MNTYRFTAMTLAAALLIAMPLAFAENEETQASRVEQFKQKWEEKSAKRQEEWEQRNAQFKAKRETRVSELEAKWKDEQAKKEAERQDELAKKENYRFFSFGDAMLIQ